MKAEELHAALRDLWTKSQVPFDRENLSEFTGFNGKKLDKVLAALVKAGAMGIDSKDGVVTWRMKGARAIDGPETLEHYERLRIMRAETKARVRAAAAARKAGVEPEEVETQALTKRERRRDDVDDDDDDSDGPSVLKMTGVAAKGALSLVSKAAGTLDRPNTGGRKSILGSAALSFMGPIGWLYAGSFREAIPALGVFSLIAWILPNPILWPLLWFALPVSALAGAAYAFQYNRKGERSPLFISAPKKKPKNKDD